VISSTNAFVIYTGIKVSLDQDSISMSVYDEGEIKNLELMANKVRQHIIKMIHTAGSGHPGGSLSSSDILTALYFKIMDHDPKEPRKEGRDRFVLSKGHAAPALYACLAEAGYFPTTELKSLRKLGSKLQGHPDMNKTPGVEVSTGSLGQGISVSVGMALAGKLDRKLHYIYFMVGDGECDEGEVWEAAMSASHYKLDNMIGFVDRNTLQIDGHTEQVMSIEPLSTKWEAFGWKVIEINGHSMIEILDAVEEAKGIVGKPKIIIANTTKGKGVSFMEGALAFHGTAPNREEYEQGLKELKDQAKSIRVHLKELDTSAKGGAA